jgi:hypothetical protein
MDKTLLHHLQETKSDEQRKIIFSRYNKELQRYSHSLNEPLAELYSYHLYTNEQSFSRSNYLSDLKESDYYNGLLKRLETVYPNSTYTTQFKNDIKRDRSTFKKDTIIRTSIFLTVLLVISVGVNFLFF